VEKIWKLFEDTLYMCWTSNNGGASGRSKREQTIPGSLNEGPAFQSEVEQEFWMTFTGKRPQARSGATSRDDDIETGNVAVAKGKSGEGIVS
jgi:hypothetical protein